MQYLINNNYYDLNELDEHYYSLLDYALICKNLKIIKYLINRKVKLGLTLYQINKEDIFIDKIKLLHAAEYDLNNLDIVGFAPIHYASTLGFADAIKLLMQYDIKILKTAINGDTPIKLAIKNSKIFIFYSLGFMFYWNKNFHITSFNTSSQLLNLMALSSI